jgi:hypothetical protein
MSRGGLIHRVRRLEEQRYAPTGDQIRDAVERFATGEPLDDLPLEAVERARRMHEFLVLADESMVGTADREEWEKAIAGREARRENDETQ